jgi:outer membrane protein TolC
MTSTSASAPFELDFWGRVKSLDDAARANFLASDYARQSLPPRP